MVSEILSFLPWCGAVNMSFTVLWYVIQSVPLFKKYERPLDGGSCLADGYRILGDSTTWGGLAWVLIGSIATYLIFSPFYAVLIILVFLGHAAGSFTKRRLGKPRGGFVPVIDHGDYVLVAGGALLAIGRIHLLAFLCSLGIALTLTPFITYLGYKLHMRLKPF